MIKAKITRKRFLPMDRFQSIPAKVDIAVGLVGPKAAVKHADSELSVAEIGTVHEFGTETIPARRWLSVAFSSQRELLKRAYSFAWKKQLKNPRLSLNAVAASTGSLAARSIRLYMLKGPHFKPALSPETIKEKRKTSTDPTRPLFNKGQLAASISWMKI